jgi:hypothetical protein
LQYFLWNTYKYQIHYESKYKYVLQGSLMMLTVFFGPAADFDTLEASGKFWLTGGSLSLSVRILAWGWADLLTVVPDPSIFALFDCHARIGDCPDCP